MIEEYQYILYIFLSATGAGILTGSLYGLMAYIFKRKGRAYKNNLLNRE